MNTFKLNIVIPDGEKFSGEAASITVKTTEGDVQILAGHADYLAAVGTGRARLVTADGTEKLASASGGFISVSEGEVSLVTTTFEFADQINIDRARKAKEKAENALSSNSDKASEALLKAKLARAMNRINVWELNK